MFLHIFQKRNPKTPEINDNTIVCKRKVWNIFTHSTLFVYMFM